MIKINSNPLSPAWCSSDTRLHHVWETTPHRHWFSPWILSWVKFLPLFNLYCFCFNKQFALHVFVLVICSFIQLFNFALFFLLLNKQCFLSEKFLFSESDSFRLIFRYNIGWFLSLHLLQLFVSMFLHLSTKFKFLNQFLLGSPIYFLNPLHLFFLLLFLDRPFIFFLANFFFFLTTPFLQLVLNLSAHWRLLTRRLSAIFYSQVSVYFFKHLVLGIDLRQSLLLYLVLRLLILLYQVSFLLR